MNNEISEIHEIYNNILSNKKLLSEQPKKQPGNLFGGQTFNLGNNEDKVHTDKNWYNKNAVDFKVSENSPVYSPFDGKVSKVDTPKEDSNTGVFGTYVYINTSDNNQVLLAHLNGVPSSISSGSSIKKGDLVGKVGKPSDGKITPVLHIATKNGSIYDYIESNGNFKTKSDKPTDSSDIKPGTKVYRPTSLGREIDKQIQNMPIPESFISEAALAAPLKSIKVTSHYGPRWGRMHHGVDLSTPSGTDILSPADGEVVQTEFRAGACGGTMVVKHGNGFSSRYCHVKEFKVSPGQKVKKGEVLGLTGGAKNDKGTGNSKGPHLHFELKKDGKIVNPIDYIDKTNTPYKPGQFDIKSILKTIFGDENVDSLENFVSKDSIGKIIKDLTSIKTESVIKEEVNGLDFGEGNLITSGSYLISKEKNSKIKSPVDGVVKSIKQNTSCKNQVDIFHEKNKKNYILQYCGMDFPSARMGEKVSKGTIIGKTDSDVTVTLFDEKGNKVSFDNYGSKEQKEKRNIIAPVPLKKKNDKDKKKIKSKTTKIKKYKHSRPAYGAKVYKKDPLAGYLGKKVSWPLDFVLGNTGKKVNEEIERIKKLL